MNAKLEKKTCCFLGIKAFFSGWDAHCIAAQAAHNNHQIIILNAIDFNRRHLGKVDAYATENIFGNRVVGEGILLFSCLAA